MDNDTLVAERQRIEADLRLDAKAFRENSIWNSEGDEIRLTITADRLEAAANYIAALRSTTQTERQGPDPADELEATIKTDRVANVRYYYSMETFAVTLRDGRQGQGSTIRAAIDSATEKEA